MNSYRVGIGFDSHRLVMNRPLFLGGIQIPFELGLLGHSDGDVLIHAIADALLGAAAAGDIGCHFPPEDNSLAGIRSSKILTQTLQIISAKGYQIENIDSVVITEKPKLAPYISKMQESLAEILSISADKISIKAKTAEGLDAVGEGKAMQAYTVVLLSKI